MDIGGGFAITATTMLAHGGHDHVAGFIGTAPVVAGLIAGAAHVITGPDHIAAVTPLAMQQRHRTWAAGCLWGLGHSGGVWLLAGAALVAREHLPIDAMSSWSERLVGLTLLAIGLWGLHRVLKLHVHATRPPLAGELAGDGHGHGHPLEHPAAGGVPGHRHAHGLLGIGALHGVAGTSHLLGVLPALALPDRSTALLYVAALGVGSILGMGIFTGGLGMLLRAADRAGAALSRGLMAASSVAAVVVGVIWMGSGGH